MTQHFTITELAREFDVTPRAIRFYEDQGLLAPRREGSSGDRARDLLDLYESPTDTEAQLHAFLATIAEHRQVLERQLEDLTATLEDLAQYESQCRSMLAENGIDCTRDGASNGGGNAVQSEDA